MRAELWRTIIILPVFLTFLGDFNPHKLPSRGLRTLWEWKNRVLLEEDYIFNVAIPPEVEREQSYGVINTLRKFRPTICVREADSWNKKAATRIGAANEPRQNRRRQDKEGGPES